MTNRRTARVLLDGQDAGRLEEVADGTRFTYLASYLSGLDARPISLTLPLRAEPYDAIGLHPFFDNLLPEGWLLEISTTKLKLGKDDAFGLLLATCADCIGAVEIYPLEPSAP